MYPRELATQDSCQNFNIKKKLKGKKRYFTDAGGRNIIFKVTLWSSKMLTVMLAVAVAEAPV